ALVDGPDKLERDTPTLANWLRDAADVLGRLRDELAPDALARQLVFENVVVQLENLLSYPTVERALETDRLEIHGWVYDLSDGSLRGYHPEEDVFRPVERAGGMGWGGWEGGRRPPPPGLRLGRGPALVLGGVVQIRVRRGGDVAPRDRGEKLDLHVLRRARRERPPVEDHLARARLVEVDDA